MPDAVVIPDENRRPGGRVVVWSPAGGKYERAEDVALDLIRQGFTFDKPDPSRAVQTTDRSPEQLAETPAVPARAARRGRR